MSRPTIADVAQRAGVSIATVSRVLNGTAPVDAATRVRVQAAIEALDYVPHPAARTLASRKTSTIGLLLPQISGAFFQPLLRGIEAGARQAEYDLFIHTTRTTRPEEVQQRPLAEHNTDGLLVFSNSLDERELQRLHKQRFPVVLLHQTPPKGLGIPVVTIENAAGANGVVSHLIEAHRRSRIVFLQGPPGQEDSHWREKGYREALETHGLPFDPALVRRGDFFREQSRQVIEELLAESVDFDAVFAGDDEAAVGVLAALRQAGRKVPQEVSVAGFDDQHFAETLVPPLTTVRAPTEQVGLESVRQLVRLIRGESVEPRLVLPTEAVLRESCGCQPR